MSFASLLDHTATIYRGTVSRGSLGEESRSWEVVQSTPCAVRRPSAILAELGPGLAPTGQRVIYCDARVDAQLRDVVALSGADTGFFQVDEPPTRPRGHHLEIRCRHYAGRLEGIS